MENFLGEIRIFGGTFAPAGWYICNGAILQIAENDALFSLIGTTYGGDGINTFALPDYRSRLVTGMGAGPGLTPRPLGQSFGSEQVKLTAAQVGSHTHPLNAVPNAATTNSPAGAKFAQPTGGGLMYLDPNFTREAGKPALAVTDLQVAANTIDSGTGGGQPHANLMPSLAINYIIASEGIYPSQQ